jgi:hypothetical protein
MDHCSVSRSKEEEEEEKRSCADYRLDAKLIARWQRTHKDGKGNSGGNEM